MSDKSEMPRHPLAFDWRKILDIFKPRQDPSTLVKLILLIIGLLFSVMPVYGALWGYRRVYSRYLVHKEILPHLAPMPPIVYGLFGKQFHWKRPNSAGEIS